MGVAMTSPVAVSNNTKRVYAVVEKADDGTYTTVIVCKNFDQASLGNLLDTLSDEGDESTFVDLPVIRELEDPDFMAELDRRIASIDDGTTKTYSMEEVFERLRVKFPPTDKE